MSTKTFTERCHIAQQFLPDAQYKAMLTKLHTEMLAKLAEQPAPAAPVQEPVGMRDAIVVNLVREGVSKHRARELADHILATTPQAQPAPVAEPFLVRLYNQGYSTGHNDTVESCYTHVYPQDLDTYHSDAVAEWLVENPQAQPAPEIAIADAYRAGVDSGIAAEREACEMAIEELPPDADRGDCAAAIRARGNT